MVKKFGEKCTHCGKKNTTFFYIYDKDTTKSVFYCNSCKKSFLVDNTK